MAKTKILSVGGDSRQLGSEEVILAMFTTASCRLEPQGWGTRFPAVMNDLASGYLKPGRATDVLKELQEIEDALRKVPVTDVVWRLDDARPGEHATAAVNQRASNALEYFVDGHGRPLISCLRDGVQECLRSSQVLRLKFPTESRDGLAVGLVLALFGLGCMLLGRALVPRWVLVSSYSDKSAIPIWTFGMDFVMFGVAIMIATLFPGLRDWFRRRPPALISVAIIAVLGWLVVCAQAGFLPD